MWAHAEYIKLVRSIVDKQVFDCIEAVRERYSSGRRVDRNPIEVWTHRRRVASVAAGCRLRVIAGEPFTLNWTVNEWQDRSRTAATPTALGVWFVDVATESVTRLRFTLSLATGDVREPEEHSVVVTERRS